MTRGLSAAAAAAVRNIIEQKRFQGQAGLRRQKTSDVNKQETKAGPARQRAKRKGLASYRDCTNYDTLMPYAVGKSVRSYSRVLDRVQRDGS